MSEQTTNLSLPYIMAAQAQKHVTHNEALRALDAVVQISVQQMDLTAPPTDPVEGSRYVIAPSAIGSWAGHDGELAAFQDNAWAYFVPQEGWLAWVADDDTLMVFDGSTWLSVGGSENVEQLGINTTADAINRLSANTQAVLFNNDGDDIRLKLNKDSTTDTASMVFQTGFSGRSELGTTGDDDFHVKVSADGTTFKEALVVDKDTGFVAIGGETPDASIPLTLPGKGIKGVGPAYTTELNLDGGALRINSSQGSSSGFRLLPFGNDIWFQNVNSTGNHIHSGLNGTTLSGNIIFKVSGGVVPFADNATSLGSASKRWSAIYAVNGVVQTSDQRDKNVIDTVPHKVAADIVESVNPVMFRWKTGANNIRPDENRINEADSDVVDEQIGRRTHMGFLAQELKKKLDEHSLDLGVWGLDDKQDAGSRQWIRPDQMIPLLWAAMQDIQHQLSNLSGFSKTPRSV